MGENLRDYVCHPAEKGSINISEEVIAVIAANAALDTDGVVALTGSAGGDRMGKKNSMKGLRLTVEEETISVDVWIITQTGVSVSGTAAKVQEAITSNIESMTGFSVAQVNVHVCGVASERSK